MSRFVSDNPEVERSIKKLISIIKKNGGYVNFYLEIHCIKGQLSLHASDKGIFNKYLMRIPHKCLVPIDEFEFALTGGKISIKSMSSKATALHKELAEIILDIYNMTFKIKSFMNVCLLQKEPNYPDLISMLYSVRSFEKYKNLKLKFSGDDSELIKAFFNTRGYGLAESEESNKTTNVMLPLMDFMNHNLRGAPFSNDMLCSVKKNREPFLSVRCRCPINGSNECYAYYGGIYDTYDLFLIYQYIDHHIPYVRSIPMNIDLGDKGSIVIGTSLSASLPKNIPDFLADLGFYVPQVAIDEINKKISLNYLFIPGDNAPFAMRRILIPTIRTLDKSMSDDQIEILLRISEKQILQDNLNFYKNLGDQFKNTIPNKGDELFFGMVNELISIQIEKIKNYRFYNEIMHQ